MRPETANRIIKKSINDLLYKGIMYDKEKLLKAIDKCLDKIFIDHKRMNTDGSWDYNFSTSREDLAVGEGGYEVIPNPLGQLHYISDRFGCDFRLYWLEEMVKNDMFDGTVKWNDYDH